MISRENPISRYNFDKKFMLKAVLLSFIIFIHCGLHSQSQGDYTIPRPKLIIGLVIDQMRWDYLYRFNELYGSDGFNRLLKQGFSCENTMVPYVPTYTAPGHSCIYTGSVPAIHGIVGNNWFDTRTGKNVYCTDDSLVRTVGSSTEWGRMSPRNLWTTTITDELRFSNNFKSKVIGIALKDRASILPAGHSANAAYWYDDKAGNWITSSYYMSDLPAWLTGLNSKHFPDEAMMKDWNTVLPVEKYSQSAGDDNSYEHSIQGESSKTFPHRLSQISKDKYEAFKFTPASITYTFDLAKAAIQNENLGKTDVPDFVAISISSTDYIGHWFGPNSVEVEDTYLRLDRDIADFLKFLDDNVGKENYLLFLTADHGVSHIPAFLTQHKTPSGIFNEGKLSKEISVMLEKKFNIKNGVRMLENYQVYLNKGEIDKSGKSSRVNEEVIKLLLGESFIVQAFETQRISEASLPEPIKRMTINGFNPKRSGDIQFTIKPAYFVGGDVGTTHGLWNPYDAHIPLIWFGWNVKQGRTNRETYMTDISPTIAAMLRIQMPNGCVGKVIEEAIR